MRHFRNLAPLAAALAVLALPAPASASYQAVIQDCAADGRLDHHYSYQDLKDARSNLPTDIREYTDCAALIDAALANGGGGSSTGGNSGGGGGGGGGSSAGGTGTPSGGVPASPADTSALKGATDLARRTKPSIDAGGQTLIPTASAINHVAGAANKLPVALLIAIAAVAVLCAAGGIAATWRRWPALARAPLRLIGR
jgi:hypothetical protein